MGSLLGDSDEWISMGKKSMFYLLFLLGGGWLTLKGKRENGFPWGKKQGSGIRFFLVG